MPRFVDGLPDTASQPCSDFLKATAEVVDFVMFVAYLSVRTDETGKIALEALAETAPEEEKAKYQAQLESLPERGPTKQQMDKFVRLMLELQITRTVDQYFAYVADLLTAVFLARPEALRSSEKVDVEFVLRHDTMEELVAALGERRVERLAYAGLRELAESVEERPGLELFASEDDLLRGVRIVEDRNLIVHNRGIVNKTYKRKVPSSTKAVGKRLGLNYADVLADIDFLKHSALRTDRIAVAKWSLPEVPVVISGVLELPFGQGVPPEPEDQGSAQRA